MKQIHTRAHNISYVTEPKHHQSTALVYASRRSTSGARYSGVPQKVAVRPSRPSDDNITLHRPKSVKRMCP
jgi:hypothetical protein